MNCSSEDNYCKGIGWKEVGIGFLISFILLCCFYPNFVIFKNTPMHSSGWELADSAVSYSNFKPSFRVIQRELITNKNMLWSSLRTMGMPILANDIQAAPLFPLTFLLSWMEENVFWNVLVMSRIILMGLGTYLLLRRFFQFQKLPSVFFVLTFVYALYVMRWMNNPWQNGLLAGIWYLYFLCLISVQGNRFTFYRIASFFGLVVAVYSMVTCGFPEAAVMSALLVIFIYVPLIISYSFNNKIVWKSYLSDLILAHIIGFALSSYQIFAILELLTLSESHRYVGLNQYPADDLIPFFAENVTQFRDSVPALFKDSRTFLGLIPITFFIVGVGSTIRHIKKISFGEIGAILCGFFIVFKMFAIGPAWFNKLVAKPPVLEESYFYVYFFSIFLWFFSYFSAKGFQVFLNAQHRTQGDRTLHWHGMMAVVSLIVLALVWFAAPIVTNESLWKLLTVEKQYVLWKILILYVLSVAFFQLYLNYNIKKNYGHYLAMAIVILATVEVAITLPTNFSTWKSGENVQLDKILQKLEERNIPLTESRIIDRDGTYVSKGLSTIDTGATPLLPIRTKLFRTNFFDTIMAGHLAIDGVKSKFSWGLSSTNLQSLDRYYGGGEELFPDWDKLTLRQGGEIHFDALKFDRVERETNSPIEILGKPQDFIYLRGWAVGDKERGLKNTSVYVVFKNEEKEIIVPTRSGVRHDVARHFSSEKYVMAGWDSYVSTSVLDDGTYNILIRFVDTLNQEYFEYKTESTISYRAIEGVQKPKHLLWLNNEEKDFLGILEPFYIYFDKTALPRAYIASKCQAFKGLKEVIDNFISTTTFQLGEVYMEELGDEEKRICEDYEGDVSRVPIRYDKGKELLLEKIQGPVILVLNDNLYPGWEAFDTIEGIPLEIKPGNITFRSLILPEKREYQVIFKYKPAWLTTAKILVYIGICLLFIPVALTMRNRINLNFQ